MIIFIDESGIHKTTGHSTTAVVYVEVENLEKFETSILSITNDLHIQSFHWGEERWQVRNKFLLRTIKLDFTVKVAIFDNPVHPGKMLEYVLMHLVTEDAIRKIHIDGEKPKWYENKLKKILRNKGIKVKKLKTVRSKSSPGIQLADCLAGVLRRYYDNPEEEDAKKWFKKLKKDKKLTAQFLFDSEASESHLPK